MAGKTIWDECSASFNKLAKDGVIGFYKSFDVVEIFAFQKDKPPFNVFSILVAKEEDTEDGNTAKRLLPPITLEGLPDWQFVIQRSTQSVDTIGKAIKDYGDHLTWNASGTSLKSGPLTPILGTFVPADQKIPGFHNKGDASLNLVLKNNFWNGSHIIELADPEKKDMAFFFETPSLLQELSTEISKIIPIRIAALSDRLGNIIIQFPVTVIWTTFHYDVTAQHYSIQLAWHPRAEPRTLQAQCDISYDGAISGFASRTIQPGETILPIRQNRHTLANGNGPRCIIYDDKGRILAATQVPDLAEPDTSQDHRCEGEGPRRFIQKEKDDQGKTSIIEMETYLFQRSSFLDKRDKPEDADRKFIIQREDHDKKPIEMAQEFPLYDDAIADFRNYVAKNNRAKNEYWAEKRIYKEELAILKKEVRIKQYYGLDSDKDDLQITSLKDLCSLIIKHNKAGTLLSDDQFQKLKSIHNRIVTQDERLMTLSDEEISGLQELCRSIQENKITLLEEENQRKFKAIHDVIRDINLEKPLIKEKYIEQLKFLCDILEKNKKDQKDIGLKPQFLDVLVEIYEEISKNECSRLKLDENIINILKELYDYLKIQKKDSLVKLDKSYQILIHRLYGYFNKKKDRKSCLSEDQFKKLEALEHEVKKSQTNQQQSLQLNVLNDLSNRFNEQRSIWLDDRDLIDLQDICDQVRKQNAPWLQDTDLQVLNEFSRYLKKNTSNGFWLWNLHLKALKDIRYLINRYGTEGAWLWDPYLSAQDILETLFYCRHPGVELRALAIARKISDKDKKGEAIKGKIDKLREKLNTYKGNTSFLNLEYRAKIDTIGSDFHDRFLIFPNQGHGARAWSLGTSVNTVGKKHHIILECPDGQSIKDAFEKLWNELTRDEETSEKTLIWKSPS